MKILKQQTPESLLEILEVEIDFLEHCVDNPFGKLENYLIIARLSLIKT